MSAFDIMLGTAEKKRNDHQAVKNRHLHYRLSDKGVLHYVIDERGLVEKVYGTKKQCQEYIKDNQGVNYA